MELLSNNKLFHQIKMANHLDSILHGTNTASLEGEVR